LCVLLPIIELELQKKEEEATRIFASDIGKRFYIELGQHDSAQEAKIIGVVSFIMTSKQ